MQTIIFSFTRQGAILSQTLYDYFMGQQYSCIAYTMPKYVDSESLTPIEKPLKELVSGHFKKENNLIFIGACGIAVRSIAPFVDKKTSDPCVLSIDEKGQYVISLLSGHIGGGNEFALLTANAIHAVPVISTATDLNHRFAVDMFAKKNHLALSDMKIAKNISAALLNHEEIGLTGLVPDGTLPEGICLIDGSTTSLTTGFCISSFDKGGSPFVDTLYLIPKQVVLGIGCKRNTDLENLRQFVLEILQAHGIFKEAVAAIASIDIKAKETAIVSLAEYFQVPFQTYTSEELRDVPGNFTTSEFVKSITGVDNVCERSTLAYSKAEKLYLGKTAKDGMTIAISLLPVHCTF